MVMEWCEPEELLCSLYAFTHREYSSLQSVAAVNAFCGLLSRFVASLVRPPNTPSDPYSLHDPSRSCLTLPTCPAASGGAGAGPPAATMAFAR